MTTPNMQLDLPAPGVTPGPDWADQLNAALEKIDSHDHSTNKGVKITPAGLNLNANLDFQDNEILNLAFLRLVSSAPTGLSAVYQNNGDLYWQNGAGNPVQITSGGTIAVGSLGTIGGDYSTDPNNPLISFSTASGDYDFYKDTTGSPIPAGINSGILTLFEEVGGANGISIASPTGLVAAYSITLPAAQAVSNNSLIQVSAAGQWSYTNVPLVNAIGVGAGSLPASLSFYNLNDTDNGILFPSTNNMAFVTAGTIAQQIDGSQHHLFTLGDVSNIIPTSPGQVLLGNGAIGNEEPVIAMYANGASGWNRIVPVLGVSDDTGSNPVLEFSARRNTGTGFGTRSVIYRFSNFNDTLVDIGKDTFATFKPSVFGPTSGNSALQHSFNGQNVTQNSDVFSSNYQFYLSRIIDTQYIQYWGARSTGSAKLGAAVRFDAANNDIRFFTTSSSIPLGNDLNSGSYQEHLRLGNAFQVLIQDGSYVTPALVFANASSTGLGNNSNNPFISRSGVRRFELTSTQVYFASGMDLGDSSTERLGTGYFGAINASGALTAASASLTGTIGAVTGNITTINATTVNATGVGQFLGGIQAGSVSVPILKWKSLSPSFAGTPGNNGSIAHGLSAGNIRDVSIAATDASSNVYIGSGSNGGGDIEITSISSTTIFFTHNVAALNSRTARVLIAYI